MPAVRLLFSVALGLLISSPQIVVAYDFEITSRTETQAYQLRRYGRSGLTFLNRSRVTQYLGLRVFNLLEDGRQSQSRARDRPPALLYLSGQLRFFSDFGEYASPPEEIAELRDDRFELLFGALQGRNLLGYVDFALGRQYQIDAFDVFGFDGLHLRIGSPWQVFIAAHVGVEVDRSRPFSPVIFETDGVSGDASDDAVAPTVGFAIGVDDWQRFALKLAYRGIASRGEPATIEANGTLRPQAMPLWGIDQELMLITAGYRVPVLETAVSLALRHNFLLASIDDLSVSFEQRLGSRQGIHVDLLHSRPHFDGDSIFNIFAVAPYREVALRYRVNLGEPLTVEARGAYRWFDPGESERDGYESRALSLALLAHLSTSRWMSTGEVYLIDGLEGWRGGGDLQSRLILSWHWQLSGRLSLVANRDTERVESRTLTTLALQIGGRVRFTPRVLLHLLLENNISQLYRSALRTWAVLDMEFAP